jgi:GT2 family glycosyltransferase
MIAPVVSVVIPTRNRGASVRRLLDALAADATAGAPPFDVVVVDDGSTDGSPETISGWRFPFPHRVLTQPQSGPALARNAGAEAATGPVLLFLDDDVETRPGTVAAHAALHDGGERLVGLGALPPAIEADSFFSIILRGWWEAMRDGIDRPGHRFQFRDLLTGHVSLGRRDFAALGGFDPALICHEDWELGYRALDAGFEMRYLAGAVAVHHDCSSLAKVLRRKFDEGVADVQLARKHPALTPALPLSWPALSRRQQFVRALAWTQSRVGDAVPEMLVHLLPLYESVRLRFRWRALLTRLLNYWYWRGVAATASRGEIAGLCGTVPGEAPASVDLAGGIDAAAREIDRLRPLALRLTFGPTVVGVVPPMAGHERLRGAHLRPLLARWFPEPYRRALARAGLMPPLLAQATTPEADATRAA